MEMPRELRSGAEFRLEDMRRHRRRSIAAVYAKHGGRGRLDSQNESAYKTAA